MMADTSAFRVLECPICRRQFSSIEWACPEVELASHICKGRLAALVDIPTLPTP